MGRGGADVYVGMNYTFSPEFRVKDARQRIIMVTFDSPIERCAVCGQFVLLDQTQEECATEHGCSRRACACALGKYFEGVHFSTGQSGKPGAMPTRRTR